MASKITGDGAPSGSTGLENGVVQRAKTAAEQREAQHSQDPEVLAEGIEKTREELAQTLDAIADKVSPKKVAKRTSSHVTATVKEKAQQAVDLMSGKAHTAAGAVSEKTQQAREAVADGAHSARGAVSGHGGADLPPVDGVAVAALGPRTDRPPVRPPLDPGAAAEPTGGTSTYTSSAPVSAEVLAGATAAAAVVLLIWGWRRR